MPAAGWRSTCPPSLDRDWFGLDSCGSNQEDCRSQRNGCALSERLDDEPISCLLRRTHAGAILSMMVPQGRGNRPAPRPERARRTRWSQSCVVATNVPQARGSLVFICELRLLDGTWTLPSSFS